MKHIIVGTNRPGSNSMNIAVRVKAEYLALGEETEIIDLNKLSLEGITGAEYSDNKPATLQQMTDKIDSSDGLIVIAPEYNGSMPGILKLFIDHMSFPKAFERRPVCFIGLGGRFGGLRPVEHLQQVFGYRNAFIYPNRIFFINVWELIKGGEIVDIDLVELLKQQAIGFRKFTKALHSEDLHANS